MEKTERRVVLSELALLLAAFIWGGGFVAGKFALESATPFWIMTIRYLGAGLFILLCSIPKLKTMTLADWKGGLVIGIFMYVGISLQTFALHYTTPGKQSFIVVSYTVLVPLILWAMTRRRPAHKELAAAVITMIGVALLSLNEQLSIGIGEFMTFLFAVIFSVQLILTDRYMKSLSVMPFTIAQMICAGLFSLVSALIFEPNFSLFEVSQVSLAGIFYLTFLNSAAAFLLQNMAQRYAKPSHTALIMALECVFGAIAAVIFTGEIFTGRMLFGCILILSAILLSKLEIGKKKEGGKSAALQSTVDAEKTIDSDQS